MSNEPFGNCKTAELHLLDRVQAFGGLLAIDEHTGLICACSANMQSFTGKAAGELLGRSWTLAFSPDQVRTMFQRPAATAHNSPHIIAEALTPGIAGFLGLRFPASDLPANARRLYLINRQRIIADVGSDTFAIEVTPGSPPLDLTLSQVRAVHPVHIQYLKNIGVEASFSLSVVATGQLWGLIACHHLTPKHVSLRRRQLCEELARMAAIHMTDLYALQLERTRARFRETLAEISIMPWPT